MEWLHFPTFSNLVASSSDYASGMFTQFLPAVYLVLGIVVGVVLIKFLGNHLINGIENLIHRGHANDLAGPRIGGYRNSGMTEDQFWDEQNKLFN